MARAPSAPALESVLALQQSAGNAATAGVLARAPLTPAEKKQNLKSPRYAGQASLEAAYDNSPPLSRGMTDPGVASVQQGMIDAGHPMPVSTKTGKPDGVFGKETDTTVRDFQGKQGLVPDGLVGRKTMGRLDELAGGKAPGEPEIANDEESLGKHVAAEMERVNKGASYGPDKGVWYDYNYYAAHRKDPTTYPWDDEWREGLAPAEYWVRTAWMDWTIKPGKSASAAIRAWLEGLTIAECLSCIVAIEIDTMRAALGNGEFDRRYGSAAGPAAGEAAARPDRHGGHAARRSPQARRRDRHVRQARRQDRRLGLLLQPPEVPAQAPGRRMAGRERRLHRRRPGGPPAVHRPRCGGQDRGRHARRDGGRVQQRAATATTTSRCSTRTPPTRPR